MRKEEFNLFDVEDGKTYIITKKEDYYTVIILLSIIMFEIGIYVGSTV